MLLTTRNVWQFRQARASERKRRAKERRMQSPLTAATEAKRTQVESEVKAKKRRAQDDWEGSPIKWRK